ncbi:hypothetical protein DSO57_1027088 [Entomophthora muscae]|uniref:Uncharacterized protein n=1 Tax=Entomophthora muscae TaxID=34485 RepID=A0ACC2T2R7_9FUNG|nr:hypothetical protein DSO57_1027088 [Entomophthora muscae]
MFLALQVHPLAQLISPNICQIQPFRISISIASFSKICYSKPEPRPSKQGGRELGTASVLVGISENTYLSCGSSNSALLGQIKLYTIPTSEACSMIHPAPSHGQALHLFNLPSALQPSIPASISLRQKGAGPMHIGCV